MQIHLTHRFDEVSQLVLEESEIGFTVTYLTHEPSEETPNAWFTNNSETFDDYNTALEVFRTRRDSENPFKTVSRYSYVTKKFEL